ncbi:MAG: hypothetical protein K2Q18_06090 [Bdellovibrionales bacterium]|nr:hypothetical protein [Bdellovibrionales bacterium]
MKIILVVITLLITCNTFAQVKWHPGHYAMIPNYGNRDVILKELSDTPLIQGVQLSYTWRELETSKDVYNFTQIDKDIEFYGKANKRVVIFLKTKSFNTTSPAPDYMNDYVYPYTARVEGRNIKLWMDETKIRLEALVKALGNKYDTHPMIEAITFNETSFGGVLTNLEIEGYFNNLIYILEKSKLYFPHTNVIQFVNFPRNVLPKLTEAMLKNKIGLGGPDTFPKDNGLLIGAYTYYPKFTNILPVTPSVQNENYVTQCFSCPPDPLTVEQLYEYDKTNLHASHIFWSRTSEPIFTKVRAMLNGPNFPKDTAGGLNSKCPSAYDSCVDILTITCPVSDKIYSQLELDKILLDNINPLNSQIMAQEIIINELNDHMDEEIENGINIWKSDFLIKIKDFILGVK